MTDDQSFLSAIADEPENLPLRLVYCDWLEEQNDPRHLYLRAWCHLATHPAEEWIGYPQLRMKLAALARELPGDWLTSLNCTRFFLDFEASERIATRYLRSHFPRGNRYAVKPHDCVAISSGWYFPFQRGWGRWPVKVPQEVNLFVHRAIGEVQVVPAARSRYEFEYSTYEYLLTGLGPPVEWPEDFC